MTRKDIDHIGWTYRKQGFAIVGGLFLAGLLAVNIGFLNTLTMPLIICTIYALVLETVESLVWAKIVKTSPDNLTNFFMGVSAVRVLSALAVMSIFYFVATQSSMLMFFGVFAVFYIAILVHHIAFFRKHTDISIDE